jgi:hypothetical protein
VFGDHDIERVVGAHLRPQVGRLTGAREVVVGTQHPAAVEQFVRFALACESGRPHLGGDCSAAPDRFQGSTLAGTEGTLTVSGEGMPMSGWSPPSPSPVLLALAGVGFFVVLGYAVLVQGAILIGLLPGVLVVAAYVLWRFLVALEAVADGVHRIADQRERE